MEGTAQRPLYLALRNPQKCILPLISKDRFRDGAVGERMTWEEKHCLGSHAGDLRGWPGSGPEWGRFRPKNMPGWFHPGVTREAWCGRGDLNPHDRLGSADFHTTSAFAASVAEFVVWTIPSPYLARGLGAAHLVSTPSRKISGLGSGLPFKVSPTLSSSTPPVSRTGTQLLKSAVSADFTTPA